MVTASLLSQCSFGPSLVNPRKPISRKAGSIRIGLSPQVSCRALPPAGRILATKKDEVASRASASTQSGIPASGPQTSQLSLNLPLAAASVSPLLLLSLLAPPPGACDVIFQVAEEAETLGYSQASYYTSLALFVISIPGLWSLIKRATKSKIVRRTFEAPGPAAAREGGGKSMAQLAGEITSLLQRNNYRIKEAKEVVTFEGDIAPNRGQAAFLVFCTALSLASVALVLSITNPDIGEWWYSMTLLSPLAGVYYWKKAARKEELQVKIVISDDEKTADIIMQGDDEEIERVRKQLNVMEKGLEYIKGVFEG